MHVYLRKTQTQALNRCGSCGKYPRLLLTPFTGWQSETGHTFHDESWGHQTGENKVPSLHGPGCSGVETKVVRNVWWVLGWTN